MCEPVYEENVSTKFVPKGQQDLITVNTTLGPQDDTLENLI